jgi:DNA primase
MSDPVLELIQKNGLEYKSSGRDYLIRCLNPEHPDTDPSFRVDRVSGVAHCFSCGFKTNIFKYYGVFTNPIPIKIAKLKEKLSDLKTMNTGQELPVGATPFTKSFRGVSSNTLKRFEAFYTMQVEKLTDRIIFPIKDITGKTQVFVARHMLSNGNPRYVNYPRGVTMPLYPPKVPAGHRSLVLVEGIFDMLNLYDKGLENVACTFGTNTLQADTKLKLFPFKAQGVTHIYLLFDGDEAGEKAAKAIKPLIEDCEFVVEIISLPDGTDPGEMGQDDVSSIIEYIKK